MRIWDGLESIEEPFPSSSVAIGTFDGVHVGHQALIRSAVEAARAAGNASVVLTFDRHPFQVLRPASAPGYLTTPDQQHALVAALDADHLVVARFDRMLSRTSPADFVRTILVERLRARTMHVGAGFRFGKGRAGDETTLANLATECGYALTVLRPVEVLGEPISSTRIRQMLASGDVVGAKEGLGREYALEGMVVEGNRLGRTLGFPTANLEPTHPQVVPGDGVYAVRVAVGDEQYNGACSIGMRPTVDGKSRTIETYLLDFSGNLYSRTIELRFAARLRDELKFNSLEELKAQMQADVAHATAILGRSGK